MSQIDPSQLTADKKLEYLRVLESAIFRGQEYISYGGDQVKYMPLDKMLQLREILQLELGLPTTPRRPRTKSRRLVARINR